MDRDETAAMLVRITGRVQGVWYRGFVVENARELGVAGWVRNRSDGSVEAELVGEGGAINELLRRCRSGPPAARVDKVNARPIPAPSPLPNGFEQRPTE